VNRGGYDTKRFPARFALLPIAFPEFSHFETVYPDVKE
jgi:hypothetical protein